MLNYEFPPLGGGTGNANYCLLREMARSDELAVDLVTSSGTDEIEFVDFSDNVRLFRLPVGKQAAHYWTVTEIYRWFTRARRFARQLTTEHRYDLCHCWSGWPAGLVGFGLRRRMPYLVALRGSDVPGYNPRLRYIDPLLFRPVSKIVWRAASRVTCVSASQARLAARTAPDLEPVIIGNGVDTEAFTPGPEPERFTILFVGRLIERKGLEYLLRAIPAVVAAGHDCRVVIAGGGPSRHKLESLILRLAIADRVSMLGEVSQSELPQLYAQASVFVLPAVQEAMSNALLEAMAAGLPLITTRNGIMDIMDNNGLTVETASHTDIERALLRYLRDPALRAAHGKRSRSIAEGLGWSAVAEAYQALYADILAGMPVQESAASKPARS